MVKSSPIMNEPTRLSIDPLVRLRKSWILFGLLSLFFLASGYILLLLEWQISAARSWLALASLTIFYLLLVLGRNLHLNYRPEEKRLLPVLGWGNQMTLLRGMLIAGVIGFLFSPKPPGWLSWLPAALYGLSVTADILDGYLARKTGHVTSLGSVLDMSFDGLGVLAAGGLLVQYRMAPFWYILVPLARYIFLSGEWVLHKMGKPVYELQPSIRRRLFASLQFVFIAVVLFPIFPPTLTRMAATFFALPFLAGFALDFLVVSGATRRYSISGAGQTTSRRILPLVQLTTRLALAGLAVAVFRQTAGLQSLGLDIPTLISVYLPLLVAMLALFGIAGRISAGLALVLLGVNQIYFVPEFLLSLQAAGYTLLVFMGSGPFSLWAPEEDWYQHPIGAPRRVPATVESHETLI